MYENPGGRVTAPCLPLSTPMFTFYTIKNQTGGATRILLRWIKMEKFCVVNLMTYIR